VSDAAATAGQQSIRREEERKGGKDKRAGKWLRVR